jgi:hypothetical protein
VGIISILREALTSSASSARPFLDVLPYEPKFLLPLQVHICLCRLVIQSTGRMGKSSLTLGYRSPTPDVPVSPARRWRCIGMALSRMSLSSMVDIYRTQNGPEEQDDSDGSHISPNGSDGLRASQHCGDFRSTFLTVCDRRFGGDSGDISPDLLAVNS